MGKFVAEIPYKDKEDLKNTLQTSGMSVIKQAVQGRLVAQLHEAINAENFEEVMYRKGMRDAYNDVLLFFKESEVYLFNLTDTE